MKKLQLITPIASIIAIICFFAPWVSCGVIKMSGFELATGAGSSGGLGADLTSTKDAQEASPILWIVLAAAVAIIVIFILYRKRGELAKAIIPTIAAAIIGLFIMCMKFIDVQKMKAEFNEGVTKSLSEMSDSLSTGQAKKSEDLGNVMGNMIKIEWGFWITALAFATCVFGSWQYKGELPGDGITGMPKETAPPYKEGSTELS
jgi:glucan phosphoethanolaminetransferase (alkaline phosphatase superfamily)